jgi:hypothetical protein
LYRPQETAVFDFQQTPLQFGVVPDCLFLIRRDALRGLL